jgi:hypothetical protein
VVSEDILSFLIALDVKEIHGYREELGLRVFKRPCAGSAADRYCHGRYEGGIDQWSGGKRSRWPFFARPWS